MKARLDCEGCNPKTLGGWRGGLKAQVQTGNLEI